MRYFAVYMWGLLTLPVGMTLIVFVQWSFQKTTGTGGCIVPWCRKRRYVLGQHYNIVVELASLRHRLLASPRHRREVLAYWQDRKDRGMGVHPRALKKLK